MLRNPKKILCLVGEIKEFRSRYTSPVEQGKAEKWYLGIEKVGIFAFIVTHH
jgi:hypothetical protein